MKLVFLTAIFATVASSSHASDDQWPWLVDTVYRYDVTSHTVTSFEQGVSNGHSLKTQFIISVIAPGHLLVELQNSQYAPVKAHLSNNWELPSDLKYQLYKDLDQTFELYVTSGRVDSIKFHSSLSVTLENVLKGLIGALQVDLSNMDNIQIYPNSSGNGTLQGVFMKKESDITGTCETLYSISPVFSEWRREIPDFGLHEDPIEIVKSRNYGNCHERIGSVSGLPDGSVWAGVASGNEEKQLISHNSGTRLLLDKRGTIYKSQVVGIVYASPMIYGKQKTELYTQTEILLNSFIKNNTIRQTYTGRENTEPSFRTVNSLLYTEDPAANFYTPGDQQNVAKAKELLEEISPLLLDTNDLPKSNFHIRFNLLVHLISALNSKQLTELTASIIVHKHSENDAQKSMWFVYRDAVALTGTPQAFQQIKSWILSNIVEEEEAVALITAIGAAIHKPSKALLEEFFNFAISPQVSYSDYFHNSALLAFTKLIRLAEDDMFTVETVIPYLSKLLELAVNSGWDFHGRPLVYVTVLGNLAHPAILNVFAPYFEGRIPVMKHFRTHIVTNLRNLANKKDPYVRSVLYSIIRNTGEPYEVRVAAALNIFLAFPTFDMMRVLACMAQNDPSTHVRAVLKSGITSAAELKDPRFTILAKTAQVVLNLLPKEKFGSQYSSESLHDEYSSDDEFSFFKEQSYIGSDDYFLQKYQRTALRFMGTGLSDENQITLSLSNLRKTIKGLYYFYYLMSVKERFRTNIEDRYRRYDAKNMMRMLKIEQLEEEPVEGFVFIETLNQQKMLTLHDIDEMFQHIKDLREGFDLKYTKLLYNKKISVVFPLVNGMPFVFEYREPIIGQANIKCVSEMTVNLEAALTFARSVDGAAGYIDTLGETFASAGVITQFQIRLPLKLSLTLEANGEKLIIGPLHPGKDENIVHFSVLPYSGVLKQNSLKYDIEYIQRSAKTVSSDIMFGGMIQFQASSYSKDYKNVEDILKNDILTTVGNLMHQRDVAYTKIELSFLGSKTNAKTVTLTPLSNEWGHYNTWFESRWGIEIDYGTKTEEYEITAAFIYNHVKSIFQASFTALDKNSANSKLKAILKYDTSKAKLQPLNFKNALINDIKVTYEVNINYQRTKIGLKGYGIRSKEYTELLKSDPMAKRCLEDMGKENYYQLDCHNMIVKAHAPDYYKAVITYKNFDVIPLFHSSSYVYKSLRKANSWEAEMNPFEKIVGDKFEIEAQAFYNENFGNYKLLSKYGLLKLDNVKGLWQPSGLAVFGPSAAFERAQDYYTGYQHLPYCAVDGSKVRTFSGRSYDYTLTGSWHVVMVDQENYLDQDLVITARRQRPHQMHLRISLSSCDHYFIELDFKLGKISENTNSEKITEGNITRYWDDVRDVPLLEYYSLTDGTQVFQMSNGHLRILYNPHRLVLFTEDFRATTMGICGKNSGQVQDDYMTPWGVVDRPDHYGASFSLDEDSDRHTLALKTEAKSKAYQPVTKFTAFPRHEDWMKT